MSHPTIVITGASQGLGEAIALAFAQKGPCTLALVARNEAKLHLVAAQVRALGAQALVIPCDVTDPEAVTRMAEHVHAHAKSVDVLVNNAGSFQPGLLTELTLDQFTSQIHANLTSAFLVSQAFLPRMLQFATGHLFFMASIASLKGYPNGSAYCAAKHGLLGLARTLREETKAKGIRVTTLMPGAARTPSWDGTQEPDDRFMAPQDIAEALVGIYALSPRTVVEEIVLRPQLGDL